MEETISLAEIFDILKKRLLLILVAILLATGAAGVVTFFLITPKYQSGAELIVQSKQNNSNVNLQSDVNANVLLINTYKDMIMGHVVLEPVRAELAEKYNYHYSIGQLKGIISVAQSQNSQMFQIKANTTNPDTAAQIANTTAKVFQEKAADVLDVNKVTITSAATVNPSPTSPNNKLNVAIGAVIGMMIGVGLAFLLELLDKTVKDERFIVEELDLPILGAIEEMSPKELARGLDLVSEDFVLHKDIPLNATITRSEREKV